MDVEMGTRIRVEAARKGISLAKLARRIEVSTQNMNEIAHGRHYPRVPTLIKLVRELGVSADYLLGLTE